ncbi:MAG: M81 family metallopeptidase [Candidatus Promineifilaceae bacterium]
MIRVAVGEIAQEGNAFTTKLSELDHFNSGYIWRGEMITDNLRGTKTVWGGIIDTIEKANGRVVPLLAAHAVAGGPLSGPCRDTLQNDFLERLRKALPVEAVILVCHGSTLAEDDDDVEGTLISKVREIVGPDIPIAATFDLHAHITDTICEGLEILVGYKTYPHVDNFETGQLATQLLLQVLDGKIRPKISLAKVNMLLMAPNQQTAYGPAALLWYEARQLEKRSDVISISLFSCHTRLDVPDMGWTAVVTTHAPANGRKMAEALCRKAWSLRHDFDPGAVPPTEAIRRAMAVDRGPVIIVDCGDATGAGAAGDSTVLLQSLLAEGVDEPCCISIVDPEAAAACHELGVGRTLSLSIGHKLDPAYGDPVRVNGYIKTLSDGRFSHTGGVYDRTTVSMGKSAVFCVGPIQILLTSNSFYEYDDAFYRAVGLDTSRARIVGMKSLMNHKFTLHHMARHMIVMDSPGSTALDLAKMPFRRVRRPIWPLDEVSEPTIR